MSAEVARERRGGRGDTVRERLLGMMREVGDEGVEGVSGESMSAVRDPGDASLAFLSRTVFFLFFEDFVKQHKTSFLLSYCRLMSRAQHATKKVIWRM
jgi:hypothetical protein